MGDGRHLNDEDLNHRKMIGRIKDDQDVNSTTAALIFKGCRFLFVVEGLDPCRKYSVLDYLC
jgi:hypothetical protein